MNKYIVITLLLITSNPVLADQSWTKDTFNTMAQIVISTRISVLCNAPAPIMAKNYKTNEIKEKYKEYKNIDKLVDVIVEETSEMFMNLGVVKYRTECSYRAHGYTKIKSKIKNMPLSSIYYNLAI